MVHSYKPSPSNDTKLVSVFQRCDIDVLAQTLSFKSVMHKKQPLLTRYDDRGVPYH